MPRLESTRFGAIDYPDEHVLHFPSGLPAFETETRFLLISRPETAPVLFLHSLSRTDLVFLALPVGAVMPDYTLELTAEDEAVLGSSADWFTLSILTAKDGLITANLAAPVVINQKTRIGVQVIQSGSPYSHQHPLARPGEGQPCS
jgi:flagellar assembly factor FliW